MERSRQALALAQELSHPCSLAYALGGAALLYFYRREPQAAQERAEAVITLATGRGFPYYLAVGIIVQDWTLVGQGQGEEGIAQIQQGLAAYKATAKVSRTRDLILLAKACGQAGQPAKGLTVLAETLAAVEKTDERECYWEA